MSNPTSPAAPIVTPSRLGLVAWSAAELFSQYPPQLRDGRKRLLAELAAAAGPPCGQLEATRWRVAALDAPVAIGAPTIALAAGAFDYAPVWTIARTPSAWPSTRAAAKPPVAVVSASTIVARA